MNLAQAKAIATILFVSAFIPLIIGGWLVFAGVGIGPTKAAIPGFAAILSGIVFSRFGTSLLREFRKE